MSSFVISNNLTSVVNSIGKNNFIPNQKAQIGVVFGVVTTENTPTKEMFEKAGGFSGIGSVFYKNIEEINNQNITKINDNDFLDKECSIAIPKTSYRCYFPLLKELIYLEDLPSNNKQISNTSIKKYYSGPINIWNNTQLNSQFNNLDSNPGITFVENSDIRPLIPFEGDHIIQGRQGATLRFSSTTKLYNNLNEWSNVGNEDNPITILTNGLSFNPKKQYYVEQINKDASSIYLTSTQKIPLQTDKTGVLNNLTNPLNAPDYFNSQVIFNADRITLNSKKDEVMIFAKTNVEINTKNAINLNADERVHLNSNSIFLGPYDINNPPQPLLLGDNTYELLESLLDSLYNFGIALSTVVGSPEGAPAMDINKAAGSLLNDLDKINDGLGKILSQQNFTV
jgi:hypothetical protein